MLQTFTKIDSDINLFPVEEMNANSNSNIALSAEDEAFYNSIKDKLNRLSFEPSQNVIDNILNHSKSK